MLLELFHPDLHFVEIRSEELHFFRGSLERKGDREVFGFPCVGSRFAKEDLPWDLLTGTIENFQLTSVPPELHVSGRVSVKPGGVAGHILLAHPALNDQGRDLHRLRVVVNLLEIDFPVLTQ